MENRISIAQLRDLLAYDAATGLITWRSPTRHRKAGEEAGCVDAHGYRRIGVACGQYGGHVIAWALYHGAWPDKFMDHKNGDRSDNSIENLRLSTFAQNSMNRKVPATNRSGAKGVCWNAASKKWQAGIKLAGKSKHLGLFDSIEAAASAYQCAARRMFGEFTR